MKTLTLLLWNKLKINALLTYRYTGERVDRLNWLEKHLFFPGDLRHERWPPKELPRDQAAPSKSEEKLRRILWELISILLFIDLILLSKSPCMPNARSLLYEDLPQDAMYKESSRLQIISGLIKVEMNAFALWTWELKNKNARLGSYNFWPLPQTINKSLNIFLTFVSSENYFPA